MAIYYDCSNCLPQTFCKWELQVPFTTGYTFVFPKFDLKAGDFVEFYDVTKAPVFLARFDAENMPTDVFTLNSSKIRVKFNTDNWEEGTGFELEYYQIADIKNKQQQAKKLQKAIDDIIAEEIRKANERAKKEAEAKAKAEAEAKKNKGNAPEKQFKTPVTLYDIYVKSGLISEAEKDGGYAGGLRK